MLGLPERCVLAWDPLLPVCPLLLLTEWEVKKRLLREGEALGLWIFYFEKIRVFKAGP
jgi:hypothetical protein